MHRKFSGRQIIAWSSLAVAAAMLIALLVVPLHKIENQSNVNSVAQNTAVQSTTVQRTTTQSTLVQNASAQNNTALQTAATQETVKNISRGAVAVNRTSGGYSGSSRYAVSYGFQVRVGVQPPSRFLKESTRIIKTEENKTDENKTVEKKAEVKKSGHSRNTFELGEPIRVSSRGKWTAGLMMRDANGRKNNNNGSQLYYDSADRKSTRLNSSHQIISYAVFC